MPGLPRVKFGMVDVRDCARAHFEAAHRPEAVGNRYLLAREGLLFTEIAEVLKEKYGETYGTKTNEISYCLIKIASWFSAEAKGIIQYWNKPWRIDNSRSQRDLGINYIEPK